LVINKNYIDMHSQRNIKKSRIIILSRTEHAEKFEVLNVVTKEQC